MIKSLIVSLCLTVLVELIIAIVLGVRDKKDIILIILVNVCTNPVVVYITNVSMLLKNNTIQIFILLCLEVLAFFIEGKIFKKCLKHEDIRPYKLSLCINLTSFSFGILLNIIMSIIK